MGTLSAAESWQNKCEDLRLLETIRDNQPDQPSKELLSRAFIVLLVASWEAFCEDLAAEALDHIVVHIAEPNQLPNALRQQLAGELEKEAHDLAVWRLAGDGWRQELQTRLDTYQRRRNWDFNTPKSEPVNKLFLTAIGMDDLTSKWKWQRMKAQTAQKKLDDLVTLRGDIAHRTAAEAPVLKDDITKSRAHVGKLVERTVDAVCDYVADLGIEEQFCSPSEVADCAI